MKISANFRYLHLCDGEQQVAAGQPSHDCLYKVRKLLNLLSTQS